MDAFLTPNNSDLSSEIVRRSLCLPWSLWHLVDGAIQELCEDENWESFGDLSPGETAQYFRDNLDDWGVCSLIGMIAPFGTATLPIGFLPCDGSEYLQDDYPQLFDFLEDVFKPVPLPGNPQTFVTPNLNGRFPLGALTAPNIGLTGGAGTVALTVANLPEHGHGYEAALGSVLVDAPSTPVLTVANPPVRKVTDNTGNGQAFDIYPPFIRLKYGILAK